MDDAPQAVSWDAPEHNHIEKGADWYWALGAVTIGAAVAAFFLGNFLFSLLVVITGVVMGLFAQKEPRVIPFAITMRGIRIDDALYPYASLESYHIDEDNLSGPQLIVRSQRMFAPLLVIPIPYELIEEIDELMESRLPEEELEEPFISKLLEFLGF